MPTSDWSGAGVSATLPAVRPGSSPAILRRTTIFAPQRSAASETGGTEAALVVAGTISTGGRSYAIVQRPGGATVRLAVGSSYAGMRLLGISPEGAVFSSGGKRVRLPFGATAIVPRAAEATIEEESE